VGGILGSCSINPLPDPMCDGSCYRLHFCPSRHRLSLGEVDGAGAASPRNPAAAMGDVPSIACNVRPWLNGQAPCTLPLPGHPGAMGHVQGPSDIREWHLFLLQRHSLNCCNNLFVCRRPGPAWCQPRTVPASAQPAAPMRAAAPARGKALHAQDEAPLASR